MGHDGWIGVYGVGYSDNVILYREHLQDGDGIEGDEIVQEQVGIHEVTDDGVITVPHGAAADIDDDGEDEHSNVYIGELTWGHDPSNKEDSPSPNISLEVDFLDGAVHHERLNTSTWERGVEANLQLYGIRANVIRDETIEGPKTLGLGQIIGLTSGAGNDYATDENLLVVHKPRGGFFLGENVDGFNPLDVPRITEGEGMALFTKNVKEDSKRVLDQDRRRSIFQSNMSMAAGRTLLHEIGHTFHVGTADDDFWKNALGNGEVYTGSENDDTPERVIIEGHPMKGWGIMRGTWRDKLVFSQNGSAYFVFTIQELLTIEEQ